MNGREKFKVGWGRTGIVVFLGKRIKTSGFYADK